MDPNHTLEYLRELVKRVQSWWYADGNGKVDAMTRARNRDGAKAEILKEFPNASFYK
jgi:hypothetical protein